MIQSENTDVLQIYNTGGWVSGRDYFFDKACAKWMCDFFRGKSVADFGCGADALYVQAMRKEGIEAYGYDSHEDTGKIPFCRTLDMVIDQPPPKRDWAMCLEVMEHIPREFEEHALKMLDACNSEGLVISWARVGQGGTGHFNERTPESVVKVFTKRGYEYDRQASKFADHRCLRYHEMGGMKVFKRCQR